MRYRTTGDAAAARALSNATRRGPLRRATCPVCSRRTALSSSNARLAHHKNGADWCKASGLTTYQATIVLAHLLAGSEGVGDAG